MKWLHFVMATIMPYRFAEANLIILTQGAIEDQQSKVAIERPDRVIGAVDQSREIRFCPGAPHLALAI